MTRSWHGRARGTVGGLAAGLVGSLVTLVDLRAQAAEPCVGAGFDIPFPQARGVETRHVDVPSPRFPGLWQQGTLLGYPFKIYGNGEAALSAGGPEPQWDIAIRCDLHALDCTQESLGTPPQEALILAERLGLCFIAPNRLGAAEVPAPAAAPVAPQTEGWALTPPPPLSPPTQPAESTPDRSTNVPTAACGVAALPEGTPGMTLQRLLAAAGGEPGPIDGFPGARTRAALIEVLGTGAANLEIEQAIAALDQVLCPPE